MSWNRRCLAMMTPFVMTLACGDAGVGNGPDGGAIQAGAPAADGGTSGNTGLSQVDGATKAGAAAADGGSLGNPGLPDGDAAPGSSDVDGARKVGAVSADSGSSGDTGPSDGNSGMGDGATSCPPACAAPQAACDFATSTCRAPRPCDLCVSSADCGPGLSCLTIDVTKMCVRSGVGSTTCRDGSRCCDVTAQGAIFVSTCAIGSACPASGGDVSNTAAADAGTAPLRDLPQCSGCNSDSECASGFVCGTVPTGTRGFCVPPSGSTQCCLGSFLCFSISGSVHLPGDAGSD